MAVISVGEENANKSSRLRRAKLVESCRMQVAPQISFTSLISKESVLRSLKFQHGEASMRRGVSSISAHVSKVSQFNKLAANTNAPALRGHLRIGHRQHGITCRHRLNIS